MFRTWGASCDLLRPWTRSFVSQSCIKHLLCVRVTETLYFLSSKWIWHTSCAGHHFSPGVWWGPKTNPSQGKLERWQHYIFLRIKKKSTHTFKDSGFVLTEKILAGVKEDWPFWVSATPSPQPPTSLAASSFGVRFHSLTGLLPLAITFTCFVSSPGLPDGNAGHILINVSPCLFSVLSRWN